MSIQTIAISDLRETLMIQSQKVMWMFLKTWVALIINSTTSELMVVSVSSII